MILMQIAFIRGMLPVSLAIIAIVGLCAMLGYYFSKQQVIARGLKKAKQCAIAEFIDSDNGRITGKVVLAGKTCIAPFSKHRCCYYQVIVEEFLSDGKDGKWVELAAEEGKGDIVLYDGTSYALIDTSHNTLAYLDIDEHSMYTDERPELKEFLASRNIDAKNDVGVDRTMRFMEGVVEEDEECAVAGNGHWEPTSTYHLNIDAQKILVLTNNEKHRLYLTDDKRTIRTS
jgi:hypothetical protein